MSSTSAVDIAQAKPSPTNPRKHFDKAKLEELAASIRESGVLQLAKGYEGPYPRKEECPAYDGCLTFAAKQKWQQGFTCGGCAGPGLQPMEKQRGISRDQRMQVLQ